MDEVDILKGYNRSGILTEVLLSASRKLPLARGWSMNIGATCGFREAEIYQQQKTQMVILLFQKYQCFSLNYWFYRSAPRGRSEASRNCSCQFNIGSWTSCSKAQSWPDLKLIYRQERHKPLPQGAIWWKYDSIQCLATSATLVTFLENQPCPWK